MEHAILIDLIVIFFFSAFTVFIFQKLNLPVIIALLLTGIFLGPGGVSLVNHPESLELLAELGVVMLMFNLGLEFSFKEMVQVKRMVFLGGGLQVLLTILGVGGVLMALGLAWEKSILWGALISLSSTAVVIKIYQENRLMDSYQGKTVLAFLIFQDLIVVPMMLFLPMIHHQPPNLAADLALLLGKSFVIIAGAFVLAKYVIPKVFFEILKTRGTELFQISICAVGLGVAVISAELGLSMSLGAFIAGLIVSETEYHHHAMNSVKPFRYLFTSLFFVSTGFLVDASAFLHLFLPIVLGTSAVILCKFALVFLLMRVLGQHKKTSFRVGLALAQVGEFSLLLAKNETVAKIFNPEEMQIFLGITILSIMASPFLILKADWIWDRLGTKKTVKSKPSRQTAPRHANRLLIVGFGVTGRLGAFAAKKANIPYQIIEMNPRTVMEQRKINEPIVFGDAMDRDFMETIEIETFKAALISVPDFAGTVNIIKNLKSLNADLIVITRSKFITETKELFQSGANEVIPVEFEASLEVISRMLHQYTLPKEKIMELVIQARFEHEPEKLGNLNTQNALYSDFFLNCDYFMFDISENIPILGKTLGELNLRSSFGINVIAIKKRLKVHTVPEPGTIFEIGDAVMVFGDSDKIRAFKKSVINMPE